MHLDVRSEILRIATRRFAEQGFDGTSVQAIAEEVGVRKASLLYHFPSKVVLRRAVLEQLMSHWNEALPRLLRAAAHDGQERFDRVLEEVVGFFAADPNRARLLVREALDRPDEMRDVLRANVSPWVDLIARYLNNGKTTKEVRLEVDPEAYTIQLISLVLAAFSTMDSLGVLLEPEGEVGERQLRQITELTRLMKTSLFTEAGNALAPANEVS